MSKILRDNSDETVVELGPFTSADWTNMTTREFTALIGPSFAQLQKWGTETSGPQNRPKMPKSKIVIDIKPFK